MYRRGFVVVALVASVAACGGDAADTTTTEAEAVEDTTTTEALEETTTTEAMEETTTTAPMEETTTTAAAGGATIPEPVGGAQLQPYGDEDITTGDVFVYWYDGTAGNRIALYTGPGIADSDGLGLCPGNSIATTDFFFISNTSAEPDSCDGFNTDTASVQVCSGGVWLYETLIPNAEEGVLFGSLEWISDTTGTFAGLTSQTPTTPPLSAFEYGLSAYEVPAMFTSDGSTTITCDAPNA